MEPFSWNLIADLQQMWSLPFMLNAFRAGTIVAILAAVVGWFTVLRRQTFAGHTLGLVGFPGAAGAVLLGLSTTAGYFAAGIVAAVVIAGRRFEPGDRRRRESALIGALQAFCLAAGMLFVRLHGGFLNGTTALLFGSFLGITGGQVLILLIVAMAALVVLAAIGRPLLYASVATDVAHARGTPTAALDISFLLLLGLTAAEVSQITGALLVFALLVLPAATAQTIANRPAVSLTLAVGIGLVTVWLSLFVAYYTPYPVGFCLTTLGAAAYLLARAAVGLTTRRRPQTREAMAC